MISRAIVTGGAGVIGRLLVRRLADKGTSVMSLDRRGLDFHHRNVDHFRTELCETEPETFRRFDPTHLFHLAASFERSEEVPEFWKENQRDNVAASAAVLQGALACLRLERYVFASSYLVYAPELYLISDADAPTRELREGDPLNPRNACGAAKLLHEREVELASRGRFTSVSARIFRVYGCGSRDVISRWIRSALAGLRIEAFDLSGRFDYILADDVAEGLVRLAKTQLTGPVNLATGHARRVADALSIISRELGSLDVADTGRTGRPLEASAAHVSRLKEATAWLPPHDLSEGIHAIIDFERAQQRSTSRDFRTYPRRALRVLLPSGGAKAPLVRAFQGALRSLPIEGSVVVADVDPRCAAGLVADELVAAPLMETTSDEQLVSWVTSTRANVVVPCRDAEMRRWSVLAAPLKAHGVHVAVAPMPAIEVCVDKLAFANWTQRHGLQAIATSAEVDGVAGDRLVVKQRRGSGSRQMFLDLDRESARAMGATLSEPVYQPMVPGMELSADFYIGVDGHAHGPVVRERRRVVGGESVDTVVVTADDIFAALVDHLAADLGFRGPGCAQGIRRDDGRILLLEVNPRFGGASAAAIASGLDLAGLVLCEAIGEVTHPPERLRKIRLVRISRDLILPE
ncbi:MAG: NAD-dependent epimerase/dehydratase family protein [Solirubrobacteraceae bacterium]